MTVSLESRVLGLLSNGGLTTEEIAAHLWPHWRTQGGRMTAASKGTVWKMLKTLEAAQQVKPSGEYRAGRPVYVPCFVNSPA